MEHKLRLVVRLDWGTAASLRVTGCLTDASCLALMPVVKRAESKFSGLPLVIDLNTAKHVDATAIETLRHLLACPADGSVRISVPQELPNHGLPG